MKNKYLFGLISLMLIGLFVINPVSAFMGKGLFRTENVDTAISNNDFTSWKHAVESELTEENFNNVIERRNNREQNRDLNREIHDSMRIAIENNDYGAWLEAAQSLENFPKDIETITEEDFNTLVEIHNARISGDFELAHELMEDSDLSFGFGQPMGGHNQRANMLRGQGKGMGLNN